MKSGQTSVVDGDHCVLCGMLLYCTVQYCCLYTISTQLVRNLKNEKGKSSKTPPLPQHAWKLASPFRIAHVCTLLGGGCPDCSAPRGEQCGSIVAEWSFAQEQPACDGRSLPPFPSQAVRIAGLESPRVWNPARVC